MYHSTCTPCYSTHVDRKSTRLNSSHSQISYAVFCLKKNARLVLYCIFLLVASSSIAQQVARGLTASNGVFIGFYEYKPLDYDANPTTKYPLIIFLHGIGERGDGTTQLPNILANAIPKYISQGCPMRFYHNGQWETFLVISPQLSMNYG